MKKTIQIPKELTRSGQISDIQIGDKKAKQISISSDTPYLRYDWYADEEYFEVLSHDAGDIDDTRLKKGLPMLFNHNRNDHLGRATTFSNDGHRINVGTTDDVIWSEGSDAQTKKKDVDSGALVGTSVGYSILDDGECIGAKDGIPIYKFKWAPHEFSFCTIEADTSVGAGRQFTREQAKAAKAAGETPELKTISVEIEKEIDDPNKKDNNAPTKPNAMLKLKSPVFLEKDNGGGAGGESSGVEVIDPAKVREDWWNSRQSAIKNIDDYCAGLKNPQWKEAAEKIAIKHKAMKDPDAEAFKDEARAHFDGVIKLDCERANPNVGIDWQSIRRFSVVKAMREMAFSRDGAEGLTGLEKEVCVFAAQQYGKKDGRIFQGACIPSDITEARAQEIFDLDTNGMRSLTEQVTRLNGLLGRTMAASNFTGGGFLVGTELMGGSFIEVLRNACFIGQGLFSIIELNGLIGNIAIPKQTTTASTYWLPEGGTVTASDFAGSQLYFTPHRLSCLTQWTKQLLLQSTPSIEMLVRNDQALAVGVEEDRVVYGGSGSGGEPLGIINTTGVGADVTFSGNWTWAKTLLFESSLESANVRLVGEPVFVTNPTTKGYAKATPQIASSTFPIFIWMPSKGEFPTIAGVKGGIVNEYGAYATKQVSANVLFGIFNNNVTKARWGGFDLMVEPYTGAATETIKSYLNEWLDVGVRYPQAFEYSTDAPTSP